jgi:superkiller protein 3
MIKKSALVCLSLVFVLSLSIPSHIALAAETDEHLLSGSKFAQDKKYEEAIREFETVLKLDPKNADANLLLGLTLANTGDLDRAAQYSQAAVELKPGYSGYHNLGLIYANQGKYDLAVSAYENAVKLNLKSYQAWHLLGLVYSAALKFEKAIEAYNKAIELNPKLVVAYQGLGSAYFWSGNTEAAYAQVAKLKEIQQDGKADELERWLKDKEAKKKKAAEKSAPKN